MFKCFNQSNNIFELDNDGLKEIIVSTGDRKVYIYRWQSASTANLTNSASQSSLHDSENGKFILLQAFELSEQVKIIKIKKFEALNQFNLQISSICAVRATLSIASTFMILATQPGCRIKDCKLKSQLRQSDSLSSSTSSLSEIITVKPKTTEQKSVKPLPLTPQIFLF